MQATVQMHPPRERKPGSLPPEPNQGLASKVWQKIVLRPEEGWTTFFLLAAVIYSAVWSIQVVDWVNGLGILTWTTAAGLALGFVAAKQRLLPRLLTHTLMMVAGVYFAFWQVAGAVYGGSIGGLWGHAVTWLRKAITPNADTNDDVMFLLFLGILSFILAYVSLWLVARTRRPWLVTLATAIVLLINLSYSQGNLIYLTIFLLAGLLLLVRFNLSEAYRQWRRRSLRYTADMGWDFMVAGILFSVSILVLSWLLPPAGTNPALASLWSSSSNPWSAVQQLFTRLFQVNGGPGYGAYFSNRLELTGSVDLPNFTVLTYTTQAPGQYLIAVTQDYFDGHSWTSTQNSTQTFGPGQSLDDRSVDLKTIEQTVHLVHPPAGNPSQYLFAAEQPVSFSLPGIATQDTSGYTSWYVRGQLTAGEQYQASSAISTASEDTLRQVPLPQAAEDNPNPLYFYPKDVVARYLQLPDDLQGNAGAGVLNLAEEWTSGATTMYDMALALESHLRANYGYSQHNDDPPSAQDAVSWFLFSEQKGFCTFFASAMVMMARMLGIPARVASGYTAGSFDAHTRQYVVNGTDAHTWAQLYFAGYGWINFEPSASFPADLRPTQATATPTSTGTSDGGDTPPPTKTRTATPGQTNTGGPTSTTSTPQNEQQVRLLLGAGGLLAVLLLLFGATSLWWRRLFRGLSPVAQTFGRVTLLAGWAGIKPKRTQTPFEYIEELQEHLPGQGASLQRLGELYVHERWGGANAGSGMREELRQLWTRLRGGLVRALLHRPSLNPLTWLQKRAARDRRGRR